ncbi:hypothetical protein NBRC3257_2786 [Gluconobacter thailandicus NBRC 3257]|uniref:Uncharacterized protein n=1 Tax=Gluconobacter thailandicus NBRC 3257 TaxID=1381097 RepID=A0ABQ0J015_GLUTH|nr:hypothetical protein NBRC3257_2786 [Gluconobacter thailandicus NBRC 3257]
MHVPPWATDTQDMQHTIEKPTDVIRWTRPTSALRRQKRTNHQPFLIQQSASRQSVFSVRCTLRKEMNQPSDRSYRAFINLT